MGKIEELRHRVVGARHIEDVTGRRVELRSIYGALIEFRLDEIERKLGIEHEGLDDLRQQISELNRSFAE